MEPISELPDRSTPRGRICAEIRAEMGRAGISGAAMARRAGWSQPYWSRRITGGLAFNTDDLDAIGRILNVHPAKFLGATTTGNLPPSGPLAQSVELRTFNPLSGSGEIAKVIPLNRRHSPQDLAIALGS